MLIGIIKELRGARAKIYEKLDQKLFSFNLEDDWTEENYQEIFDVLCKEAKQSNNISELNKNIHLYVGVKRIKREERKKKYLHFYFKKDR